jgi:hypothetical protein
MVNICTESSELPSIDDDVILSDTGHYESLGDEVTAGQGQGQGVVSTQLSNCLSLMMVELARQKAQCELIDQNLQILADYLLSERKIKAVGRLCMVCKIWTFEH